MWLWGCGAERGGALGAGGWQTVDLTPKEFQFGISASNKGIPTTERLLEEVWGYSFYTDARTVDVHVGQLRKKLGRWAVVVHTVWGLGYKADPNAEPVDVNGD